MNDRQKDNEKLIQTLTEADNLHAKAQEQAHDLGKQFQANRDQARTLRDVVQRFPRRMSQGVRSGSISTLRRSGSEEAQGTARAVVVRVPLLRAQSRIDLGPEAAPHVEPRSQDLEPSRRR